MSFLAIEGLHVFVTGAAGGIGQAIVAEFLEQGCKVTACDLRRIPTNTHFSQSTQASSHLLTLQADISNESSIASCIREAQQHFGPIHILAANAGITDESAEYPIWKMPVEIWDKTYAVNVRGTFFTIKHFLQAAKRSQESEGKLLDNLAVVVTGSECGKFGQAGHGEYASGKAALQYGLVRTIKNEIVKLNPAARINAVAPGWVDTPLITGRLDDSNELYLEAQATVPLKKIAKPTDVARTVAFLASHRAAGHITGECVSVDGGMEGRVVWRQDEISRPDARGGIAKTEAATMAVTATTTTTGPAIPQSLPLRAASKPKQPIQIAISVDFDAVSGWLGTGSSPSNTLSDYSTGFFSAQVGVPRLLKLFNRLGISPYITWFIPMHSAESFPEQFASIQNSGCEIGLHGYCHEGGPQLTDEQERDVLEYCIEVATKLLGKKPVGYRAPLYQLKESTIGLLEEKGFLYDSSLSHRDCEPYWLPRMEEAIHVPVFKPESKAKEWMRPLPKVQDKGEKSLVEIPGNWYAEDMTPLQFWPHTENSQGYVDVRVVEQMWKDKFEFMLREREEDEEGKTFVFPLILHPDTSGMAHIIGMIERMMKWLQGWGDQVEFATYEKIATEWKKGHE